MFSKKLNTLILLSALTLQGLASADIWKCDNSLYTSIERPNSKCSLIPASIICGSDGNKYITPDSNIDKIRTQECQKTGKSKNIFVNEVALADYKNRKSEEEPIPIKKLQSANDTSSRNRASKSESSKNNPLGKSPSDMLTDIVKNPANISQLLQYAFPAVEDALDK